MVLKLKSFFRNVKQVEVNLFHYQPLIVFPNNFLYFLFLLQLFFTTISSSFSCIFYFSYVPWTILQKVYGPSQMYLFYCPFYNYPYSIYL